METYRRYGISQKLGRFTATVLTTPSSVATVVLSLQSRVLIFAVSRNSVQMRKLGTYSWHEWIARMAVAQGDKAIRNVASAQVGLQVLDLIVVPWIGDLLLAPGPGGTLGIHRKLERQLREIESVSPAHGQASSPRDRPPTTETWVPSIKHRAPVVRPLIPSVPDYLESQGREKRIGDLIDRRRNVHLTMLVQQGIELQLCENNAAAMHFLLNEQVPRHTIARVLIFSSLRRNPARPTSGTGS